MANVPNVFGEVTVPTLVVCSVTSDQTGSEANTYTLGLVIVVL